MSEERKIKTIAEYLEAASAIKNQWPNSILAFRGQAWLYLGEWEKAKSDLTIAKNMGADIIALFRVIYKDIAELEQKIGAVLPEDITAVLAEKPK